MTKDEADAQLEGREDAHAAIDVAVDERTPAAAVQYAYGLVAGALKVLVLATRIGGGDAATTRRTVQRNLDRIMDWAMEYAEAQLARDAAKPSREEDPSLN